MSDTRLEQKAPTTNYATGTTLWGTGNADFVGHLAEAALKFDCSAIPSGVTVESATLKLYVTFPTTDTYELFELKHAWTESGATWNNYISGTAWEVAGARGATDRGTAVLGRLAGSATGQAPIVLTSAGKNVVSGWINGTTANKGVLFRPPLSNDDIGFQSGNTTSPPTLTVTTSSGTVTLSVLDDTRLEEKAPTTNYATATTLYAAGNVNAIGQLAQAALRFDTSNFPAGATIQSAALNIDVNFPTTDTYQVYELKQPWTESGATWQQYAPGAPWQVAGAKGGNDRGTKILGSVTAASSGATSISFNSDGLALISGWASGTVANNGIVLRSPAATDDIGFHSRENTTPPVLEVTYSQTAGTVTEFKLVHWNIHHGNTPGGTCALSDMIAFVANTGASMVSLNEVEYLKSSYCSGADQPAQIEAGLETRTGRQWSRFFAAQQTDGTATQGNLVLYMSNTPPGGDPRPGFGLISSARLKYANQGAYIRTAGRVTMQDLASSTHVVTLVSTHLEVSNEPMARLQAAEVRDWVVNEEQQRIISGDWNATPGTGPVNEMTPTYFDSWAACSASSTCTATSVQPNGGTRTSSTSRIDYVFYSKGSTLQVVAVDVPRPKTAGGQDISDHLPIVATYRIP